MTNKLNRSIVSIVLEIQKREDNEIPPHFIHEVKTKKVYLGVYYTTYVYIF